VCALQAVFEVQKDACFAGQKVVIVDDLLATGGKLRFFDVLAASNYFCVNLSYLVFLLKADKKICACTVLKKQKAKLPWKNQMSALQWDSFREMGSKVCLLSLFTVQRVCIAQTVARCLSVCHMPIFC